MATIRTRPTLCECPTFPCPCPAQIYNRAVGKWYCDYCTSRNYNLLNRCCRCELPGRCVDQDTGDWYCEEHGHQCDVLVPRPPGCGWPAQNLPCSQCAHMIDHHGRYVCDHHLVELIANRDSIRLRPLRLRIDTTNLPADAALLPPEIGADFIDIDAFSTVVQRECPICFEPKLKWRQLTACGHELCEDCLREQIRSSLHNRYLCPFDRRSLFDLPSE